VLIPSIALGLPIVDTLLAIGRRALRGRPLFQADKEHIHHKLLDRGLTHRQAVLVLYGFCILLGAAALVLTYASSGQSALLLVVLALVAFVFLRSLGYIRLDRVTGSAVDRKRNRAMRAALHPLGRRIRQLCSLDEMWPLIIEAAGVVGAARVELRLDRADLVDDAHSGPLSYGPGEDTPSTFWFPFVIPGGDRSADRTLNLGWLDGRTQIDRDTEIAVEIFCQYLGDALDLRRPTTTSATAPSPRPAPRD